MAWFCGVSVYLNSHVQKDGTLRSDTGHYFVSVNQCVLNFVSQHSQDITQHPQKIKSNTLANGFPRDRKSIYESHAYKSLQNAITRESRVSFRVPKAFYSISAHLLDNSNFPYVSVQGRSQPFFPFKPL